MIFSPTLDNSKYIQQQHVSDRLIFVNSKYIMHSSTAWLVHHTILHIGTTTQVWYIYEMKQQQQLEETACYRSFFVYRIVLVCAEQPLSSTFQRKRVFIVAKMLANSFCKCQNCLITPVAISRQFGWIIIATLSLRLE